MLRIARFPSTVLQGFSAASAANTAISKAVQQGFNNLSKTIPSSLRQNFSSIPIATKGFHSGPQKPIFIGPNEWSSSKQEIYCCHEVTRGPAMLFTAQDESSMISQLGFVKHPNNFAIFIEVKPAHSSAFASYLSEVGFGGKNPFFYNTDWLFSGKEISLIYPIILSNVQLPPRGQALIDETLSIRV